MADLSGDGKVDRCQVKAVSDRWLQARTGIKPLNGSTCPTDRDSPNTAEKFMMYSRLFAEARAKPSNIIGPIKYIAEKAIEETKTDDGET
ncbi:hypothetical protein V6667_06025 [Neisseria leonii]|uniref:Uncharacterized protein n=1 Tax=Neisseria leonii TaxID=2995413 RepID=A0A9X4E1J8_9NEIS|nr:hypothetical protein [Neisseria sp. 51.81]MDD9327785.1 hypothetical protein [Neisseria sp. 51.81]